ncbi:MAG: glycogen debranching N-terminal domain-containing protein [Candidatus Methylacidiphilaceae bacterium]
MDSEFAIGTPKKLMEDQALVLKRGDTFGVFNQAGDADARLRPAEGLFRADTRFLSRFRLLLGRAEPLLLSSHMDGLEAGASIDLTNVDLHEENGRLVLPSRTIHLLRRKRIYDGGFREELWLHNYGSRALSLDCAILFEADFADIFEVRGKDRSKRGRLGKPRIRASSVTLGYRGMDSVERITRLTFTPTPTDLGAKVARYHFPLGVGEERKIEVEIECFAQPQPSLYIRSMARRPKKPGGRLHHYLGRAAVRASNEHVQEWIDQARADLEMLVTPTHEGLYPFAGVPWFSTVFGRDGIVTAFQYLWLDPHLAQGVLRFLAAHQAKGEEEGKILHEMRQGEMAATGEVPFGLYYGSIDATPLFVALAGALYARTADKQLIERLWPHIELALRWMETRGDLDRDGFLEYTRPPKGHGLWNQGWKDSDDSVFHADGRLAEGPIALCEVQGYAYAAWTAAAGLARVLGKSEAAGEMQRKAEGLQKRFEEAFWCEEIGTYALALDGEKKPCRVPASNAGHALFSGIASVHRARRVAELLLSPSFFSGWGIRTLPEGAPRYNPMSYHNGSVWPHDNSLIALGLARYGFSVELCKLADGLFCALDYLEEHRLPELFCGFPRRPGSAPVRYPIACRPQGWASGSLFALLAACLGIGFQAESGEIRFEKPVLPAQVEELLLQGLSLKKASVDVLFRSHIRDVAMNVVRRRGSISVVLVS